MLSAPKLYVPQDTFDLTPAEVGRRYRLRRAVMTACELAALGLFVAAVLAWSAIGGTP